MSKQTQELRIEQITITFRNSPKDSSFTSTEAIMEIGNGPEKNDIISKFCQIGDDLEKK
jgi:hypothetical protein